ncbi:hypothetical protein BgiBS90_024465 [Biomphalaria glabrata]|nr:hypothetical protein BgiBS90_024465 [Biomphalaria glabrata]
MFLSVPPLCVRLCVGRSQASTTRSLPCCQVFSLVLALGQTLGRAYGAAAVIMGIARLTVFCGPGECQSQVCELGSCLDSSVSI